MHEELLNRDLASARKNGDDSGAKHGGSMQGLSPSSQPRNASASPTAPKVQKGAAIEKMR